MGQLHEISDRLNQAGILPELCVFVMLCLLTCLLFAALYVNANHNLKKARQAASVLARKVKRLENSNNAKLHEKKQSDEEAMKFRYKRIASANAIPEKYRYVARLERSGLDSREIAEILDVSIDVAEQMLALARLSDGYWKDRERPN